MAVKRNLDWITTLGVLVAGSLSVIGSLMIQYIGYGLIVFTIPIFVLCVAYKIFSRYRQEDGRLMTGPKVLLALGTIMTIGWVGLLGLGLLSYAINQGNNPVTPQQPVSTVSVQELHLLINQERARVGAPPLGIEGRLTNSAQLKANDMVSDGYFDHVNPKTGKRGISYITDSLPGQCQYINENITDNIHSNTSESAVNAWINSPSHYSEMVSPRYDTVGYGISGTKIVQHMCDLK